MPFPTILTDQQKTDIRDFDPSSGDYRRAYFLATPQDIVFQATVNGAVSGQDYASILFDTPSTGAYTDIKAGMTVIVHRDSSDIDDHVFPPTYARGTASSSAVNIGWTAVDLEDTDTITVLNDYRLHPRQVRADSNVLYHDYDETFYELPPCIYGLQSVYASNSSSAVEIDFAPTVEAMESGAGGLTFLWDVGDGTITSGTSASKDITVSFPAWTSGATSGWHWVSLTATDDNGNATTFYFQVFVGDFHSATWVLDEVRLFDIGNQMQDGALASLTLGSSAANLYKNNHISVVVDESNTTIVSNVLFLGRIQGLVDENIARYIQDAYGIQIEQSTTYEVEGYGAALDRLPMPFYPLKHDDSADMWHEVKDLSLARAIWYGLIHLTTAPTIMSFDLSTSTYNSYQSVGFDLDNGSALGSIQRLADFVGARLIFARSGEAVLLEDAVLQSSANRDALDTVVDLITDDMLERIGARQPSQPLAGQLTATHGAFTSNNNKVQLLRVKAPKIPNTLGVADRQVDLLLTSDDSESNWIAEASVRTANYLASLNETHTVSVRLKDGYWFLVPHNQQWYTITESFQSGLAYDSNTRWILSDCSLSIQMEELESGAIIQNWLFETSFNKETEDIGTASTFAFAPDVRPYSVPQMPLIAVAGSNYDPNNAFAPGDTTAKGYASDSGEYDFPSPTSPPDTVPPKTPFRDTLRVPLTGETVSMSKATVNGEVYTVKVSGAGTIAQAAATFDTVTFDDGGNEDYSVQNGSEATYDTNTLLEHVVSLGSGGDPRVGLRIDLGEEVDFTGIQFRLQAVDNGQDPFPCGSPDITTQVQIRNAALSIVADTGAVADSVTGCEWLNYTVNLAGTGRYIDLDINLQSFWHGNSRSLRLDDITPLGTAVDTKADAFYQFVPTLASLNTYGLQQNGGAVATPSYKGNHTYTYTFTGDGTAHDFAFTDPDLDYTDNNGYLNVTIEGNFDA